MPDRDRAGRGPSGPVLVSTPGTLVRSGWPFRRDSGAMNVDELVRVEEAGLGERRVERRRGVALAEHEAVAVGVVGLARVDAQDAEVERGEDVDGRELAAEVAQPGLVDHAQVAQPDRVRAAAQLARPRSW